MTEKQSSELEELFKEKLKEQYNRGIQVGVLSISKIISDKLNDSSIPFLKRIEDVKRICRISPDLEKKYNEIVDNKNKSENVSTENTDSNSNEITDIPDSKEEAETTDN